MVSILRALVPVLVVLFAACAGPIPTPTPGRTLAVTPRATAAAGGAPAEATASAAPASPVPIPSVAASGAAGAVPTPTAPAALAAPSTPSVMPAAPPPGPAEAPTAPAAATEPPAVPGGTVPTPPATATIPAASTATPPAVAAAPTQGSGALTPTPTASTGARQIPFVGVWIDDYKAPRVVELAGRGNAGVGAATVEVHWDRLERTEGAAWDPGNAAELDAAIRRVVDGGMLPVLIVGWAPSWAAPAGPRAPLLDGKREAFARFVQALARRYSVPPYDVHHYFLWPEADHGTVGDDDRIAYGADGRRLAQLFNMAGPAIKAVDPHARVMAGPFAHDNFTPADPLKRPTGEPIASNGPFHYSFLPSFMSNVNPTAIDALGLNAYPAFGFDWEVAAPGQGVDIAAKYDHVRSTITPLGFGALPIVFGEAGFWRDGSAIPLLDESGDGKVIGSWVPNEENQARYIPKYLARAKERGVAATFHFTFDEVRYEGTRGLIGKDGSLKPGYHALRHAATVFGSAASDPAAAAALTTVDGSVEKYGLASAGGRVVVAWARGAPEPTATVSAPPGSSARDKVGAVVLPIATEASGRASFRLTGSPLYISFSG